MSKFLKPRNIIDIQWVPIERDDASSPSGTFDTPARLDVRAALMRNTMTGPTWNYSDPESPNTPTEFVVSEYHIESDYTDGTD